MTKLKMTMKMTRLFWGFVSAVLCCQCVLTSCNNDESSQASQDMRAKIQNTRWKMTEVYVAPDEYSIEKVWIPSSQYDKLVIYELSFDDKGNYRSNDLHYSAVVGRGYAIHSGEYHVANNKVYMGLRNTNDDAHGNYNITILQLQGDEMEAEVGWIPNLKYYDDGSGDCVWKSELDKVNMQYLVRMKRF